MKNMQILLLIPKNKRNKKMAETIVKKLTRL
jgi:hypothetical protein